MDILIIVFCLTILYISSSSRIESYIRMLSVQGVILFLMSILDFGNIYSLNFIILILETLGLKAIVMPLFLTRIVRKNEIYREVSPYISNFHSIVITSVIFAFGFLLSYWSIDIIKDINPLRFGLSISTIIASLFIIVNRKKVITHVLGYMIFENGIFLLSLSMAKEMPIIVDLGILMDLFIGVLLIGVFVNKLHENSEQEQDL